MCDEPWHRQSNCEERQGGMTELNDSVDLAVGQGLLGGSLLGVAIAVPIW